jgi:myosin heavy subunit
MEKALYLKEDEVEYLQKLNSEITSSKNKTTEKLSQLEYETAEMHAIFAKMQKECELLEEQKREAEVAIESSVEEIEALDRNVEQMKSQMKRKNLEYAELMEEVQEGFERGLGEKQAEMDIQLKQKDATLAKVLEEKQIEYDELHRQHMQLQENILNANFPVSIGADPCISIDAGVQTSVEISKYDQHKIESSNTGLHVSNMEAFSPCVFVSRNPFSAVDFGDDEREIELLKDIHDLVEQLCAAQAKILQLEQAQNSIGVSDVIAEELHASLRKGGNFPAEPAGMHVNGAGNTDDASENLHVAYTDDDADAADADGLNYAYDNGTDHHSHDKRLEGFANNVERFNDTDRAHEAAQEFDANEALVMSASSPGGLSSAASQELIDGLEDAAVTSAGVSVSDTYIDMDMNTPNDVLRESASVDLQSQAQDMYALDKGGVVNLMEDDEDTMRENAFLEGDIQDIPSDMQDIPSIHTDIRIDRLTDSQVDIRTDEKTEGSAHAHNERKRGYFESNDWGSEGANDVSKYADTYEM